MLDRDYVKTQLDILPEEAIKKIIEFIMFQKFCFGLYDNDTDYLTSMPEMAAIIREGLETPLSECVSLSEVWADV